MPEGLGFAHDPRIEDRKMLTRFRKRVGIPSFPKSMIPTIWEAQTVGKGLGKQQKQEEQQKTKQWMAKTLLLQGRIC